jgi:signal transduction histidine kinase
MVEAKGGKKANILVIDDEKDIRLLIETILKREGYDVFLAEDGYEGIKCFKEEPMDLVITDIKMPGMDGIEVLKRLKEITPDVEVVILTGHGNLDTAIAAIKESAFDFVSKPLDNIHLLITTVETGVEKRRLTLENKRLLKELREANEELNQKNKNYFEVLGFVSHELKNALTILSGYVGLFHDNVLGELNEKQKNIMNKITSNVESINNLIINYLNLSKIEKGELIIEKNELDVYNDILKNVIDIMTMQAERNKLNVDLSLGGIPKGVKLNADVNLLRMVFLNLFINAINYTKEGGKISYGYEEFEDCFRFNVYNEGEGIPPEFKDKIFEKFVRIKTKTCNKKEGSGIGLFTVKNIIEAHGGRIWVETDSSSWANFVFELPKEA